MYEVRRISFEACKRIWQEKLWPGRKSEIKHMSSMQYLGEYDMSIYINYKPSFWGIYDGAKIIGVNSGHRTKDELYRSRGIWVDPDYRGKGLATMLFTALEEQARSERCTQMWSAPRKGSEYAYYSYGFKSTSDWFDEGMEFGPNCYVLAELT